MNIKNLKIKIIISILSIIFLIIVPSSGCKKEMKKYNVVLIVIDTLRSDHLASYGYKRETAPFISEFAKSSILFENVFSASSWTSPATASIFTSLYPFQHKVYMGLLAFLMAKKKYPDVKIDRIPEEIETITEVLKSAGYSTFGISDNLNIGKKQGFHQGFDKMETYEYKGAPAVNKLLFEWKEEIDKSDKYFLYLHYMDPHAPYHSRKPWYRPQEGMENITLESYDTEINYVDQYIRKAYEAFGWDKNTIVIITSDHGEGLWDHGRMGHGYYLYREEIQVPLIIKFPEGFDPKRIDTNVTTIDILPTVRDALGLQDSKTDSGKSLIPLIRGKKDEFEKRYIFSYLWKKVAKIVEYKATIYKKLHFIKSIENKKELYNMAIDKKEEKNYFLKAFRTAKQLEEMFEEFFMNSRKFTKKSITYKMTKEKLEKLKTLGYVE
ncbi:MAG: sulfatase [Acidobacteriota bacterium]